MKKKTIQKFVTPVFFPCTGKKIKFLLTAFCLPCCLLQRVLTQFSELKLLQWLIRVFWGLKPKWTLKQKNFINKKQKFHIAIFWLWCVHNLSQNLKVVIRFFAWEVAEKFGHTSRNIWKKVAKYFAEIFYHICTKSSQKILERTDVTKIFSDWNQQKLNKLL